jgi:hypothetical protein
MTIAAQVAANSGIEAVDNPTTLVVYDHRNLPVALKVDAANRLHIIVDQTEAELAHGTATASPGHTGIITPVSNVAVTKYKLVALLVTRVAVTGGVGAKITAKIRCRSPRGVDMGICASYELAPGETGALMVGPDQSTVELSNKIKMMTGRLLLIDIEFTASGNPDSFEVDYELVGLSS